MFHTEKKNVQRLTVNIDNVFIKRVVEFNFWGLTLDEHLTWKYHINKISNDIFQCKGILDIISAHPKMSMFTQMYKRYTFGRRVRSCSKKC